MARSCVFCGCTGKLTLEHVWPDWLARFVIEEVQAPWVKVGPQGVERIWDAPMFHNKVRRVCAKCNAGSMADLEGKMQPFLRWMLLGRDLRLDPETQGGMALWCVVRAYMAQFVNGAATVPPEHFHWVHERGFPPQFTTVWLGCYAGRRYPVFAAHQGLTVAGGPNLKPTSHNAYLSTFSVGRFVFQVFGQHVEGHWLDLTRPPAQAGFFQRIWPDPVQQTAWPPSQRLNDAQLREVASMTMQKGPGAPEA